MCSFQKYLHCSESVVNTTCGYETARFTKSFLDRMSGPLIQVTMLYFLPLSKSIIWAISYFHIDIKSYYYLGTLSSLRVWLGRLSYDYRWPMGRIQPRISISSVVFICLCYLPVPSNQIPIKHNQHISKRNYTIGHFFDNTCTITPKIK